MKADFQVTAQLLCEIKIPLIVFARGQPLQDGVGYGRSGTGGAFLGHIADIAKDKLALDGSALQNIVLEVGIDTGRGIILAAPLERIQLGTKPVAHPDPEIGFTGLDEIGFDRI